MKDMELVYAKVFGGLSGDLIIKHLRKITIERTLGPNATESELRFVEGQRALVHQIEQMVQRGKSNAKA